LTAFGANKIQQLYAKTMAGAEQQDPELVMADGQEEEEEVVTLSEVIEKDAELNEAANAVLGDCSESNCSYPLGYIRQVSQDKKYLLCVCLIYHFFIPTSQSMLV
jgi:hypothetical protein